jgi:hypothetical protein
MSGESRRSQTERDEEAYQDAWYRALKAKAEDRFPDPGEERSAGVPSETSAAPPRATTDPHDRV